MEECQPQYSCILGKESTFTHVQPQYVHKPFLQCLITSEPFSDLLLAESMCVSSERPVDVQRLR